MQHKFYNCPPGCDRPYCMYCEGGLSLCTICGQAEGDLEESCPGNAQIRDAAPDMVDALELAVNWLASYPGGLATKAWEAADTALHKAGRR